MDLHPWFYEDSINNNLEFSLKYSFSYMIKNSLKIPKFNVYIKFFILPIAIPLAWLLLNFSNISANTVTFIGLFIGLLGSVLGILFGLEWLLICFTIFYILDIVDGRIASGRGGSTSLGIKLDFFTDRTVLIATLFTLSYYHTLNSQIIEIMLLMVYSLSFFWLDSIYFGNLKASFKSNSQNNSTEIGYLNNSINISRFNKWKWVPTRLSSYIFVIIGFIITDSFQLSYIFGIISVVGEVFIMVRGKIIKFVK